jgi:hypothetical protein
LLEFSSRQALLASPVFPQCCQSLSEAQAGFPQIARQFPDQAGSIVIADRFALPKSDT